MEKVGGGGQKMDEKYSKDKIHVSDEDSHFNNKSAGYKD